MNKKRLNPLFQQASRVVRKFPLTRTLELSLNPLRVEEESCPADRLIHAVMELILLLYQEDERYLLRFQTKAHLISRILSGGPISAKAGGYIHWSIAMKIEPIGNG